jgi:drug/metabolite transporter (DMT)-like permease
MLGYLFAFFAALANATSSVLQRRAGQDESNKEMSLRLIVELVRKPVWLGGMFAVVVGFVLQATALSYGKLSAVQPVLIVELPITVLLSWHFLGGPRSRRQIGSITAMTIGLGGLLFFLSPTGGNPHSVPAWLWAVALAVGYGVVGGLVLWGRRTGHDMGRSAIYATAAGIGFGMTAALMKGMTADLQTGFTDIFVAWQTYLMVATGVGSMYLVQNALAAGRLVAAQPGLTLADPMVAILWGTLVFGEQVRVGVFLILAVVSFAVVVASVVLLSRDPVMRDADDAGQGSERSTPRAWRSRPGRSGTRRATTNSRRKGSTVP